MPQSSPPSWSQRYGRRHQLHRITAFPAGIEPPQKVRIYRRVEHYVLQAWDPAQRRTISVRVDGDLLAALMRARQIDERLLNYRRSGIRLARSTHSELVERYLADLGQRADAGEISTKTVKRYGSALQHYLHYTDAVGVTDEARVQRIDRDFVLRLAAHLKSVTVSPNGHPHAQQRPLASVDYILDVVRGMYRWAADPQRGNLLGDGFINPFTGHRGRRAERDPLEAPAITQHMAAEFFAACDNWQLSVFSAVLLWGLRPSELGWIFHENCKDELVAIKCLPELDYATKGRRDKRVPVLPLFKSLWFPHDEVGQGFVFRRRQADGTDAVSVAEVVDSYRDRLSKVASAGERQRIRNGLQRELGGVDYDTLEREFHKVAKTLNWPRTATLKGFRHLFATSLENAGMPEFYRKYLMGQSTGRSAIVTYTHLTQLREQYQRAITSELADVIDVLQSRLID